LDFGDGGSSLLDLGFADDMGFLSLRRFANLLIYWYMDWTLAGYGSATNQFQVEIERKPTWTNSSTGHSIANHPWTFCSRIMWLHYFHRMAFQYHPRNIAPIPKPETNERNQSTKNKSAHFEPLFQRGRCFLKNET